jgi:hypothetical protein
VEARWKGRPRYFHGSVVAVHADGCCYVVYDDGEVEDRVRA